MFAFFKYQNTESFSQTEQQQLVRTQPSAREKPSERGESNADRRNDQKSSLNFMQQNSKKIYVSKYQRSNSLVEQQTEASIYLVNVGKYLVLEKMTLKSLN